MVKSIIKRIIVGVGIALCLMAIKDGGLIGQVYALSCDSYEQTVAHPLDSFYGNIPNTSTGSNENISYYRKTTYANDNRTKIYFNGADYIEIMVPAIWTYSFGNSPVYNAQGQMYQFDVQGSPPLLNLEDNTNNSSNNAWTQGQYENGYYFVRYYKNNFPNSDYINLTALRISVPSWYYNTSTDLFVWFNGFFQVRRFKCDSNQALQNAIDENTQAVEDVNETLNDDTVDNNSTNSTISTMNSQLASNNSITQLLTLPITLFQSILNSVSGSCSSFSLGSLYNHNLTLPCINLENLLGSTLYGIIDILISGIFILSFRKKMVDIFNNMTSLKDRGNELE